MKNNDIINNNGVAVLGLGAMGSALANALLNNNVNLIVWNRTAGKATGLLQKGAREAQQVTDAIDAASIVVVCLLTYDTVYETLTPAAHHLQGKVLVNLTNGTPAQACAMHNWASLHGASYLDGGIMAIPPMIGTPASLVLYSGSRQAFDTYKPLLQSFGDSKFVGEDPGLAPLHDIALLAGMYGLFTGAMQSMALISSAKVCAVEFMPLLKNWLQAMMGYVENLAVEVDANNYYDNVTSNLGMQAAAYINIIDACKQQQVSTELVTALQQLMQRGITQGHSAANLSVLVELLKKPAS